MVMRPNAVLELANDVLIPGWQTEKQKLDEVDKWLRWDPEKVRIPSHADPEARYLRDLSETPWGGLIVTTVAQQLIAELVRSTEVDDVSPIWRPWLRNRMPSRQRGIYRAALGYGYAYSETLPGDSGAVIRGHSPRNVFAMYQDAVIDEYPMYYLHAQGNRRVVVDDEAAHELVLQDGKLVYVEPRFHGIGVAPLVRYSNQIDLEGRTPGEIEPFVPVLKRINKTSYDRLLTQHFNSWKIRTATGLDMPSDPVERERVKLLIRQQDILTGEEGVQFGTLDETPLEGFIKAWESDVEALAAVSQTPAHALTGKMINLSADAIIEARSMLALKSGERKIGFGDSNTQTLRLASFVEGRTRDAEDFTLTMDWKDFDNRSLSIAADALGKLAASLGIPVEKLWDRIPGVDKDTADAWLKYKKDNPSADEQLAAAINTQSNGTDG